jgi:hypothetical protein
MESLGGNPPEIGFPEFSAVWAYTPRMERSPENKVGYVMRCWPLVLMRRAFMKTWRRGVWMHGPA